MSGISIVFVITPRHLGISPFGQLRQVRIPLIPHSLVVAPCPPSADINPTHLFHERVLPSKVAVPASVHRHCGAWASTQRDLSRYWRG